MSLVPEVIDRSWLAGLTPQVLDKAVSAVKKMPGRYAASSDALTVVLTSSAPYRDAVGGQLTMAAHLPLLVHSAVAGHVQPAVPLAAALLLLEAGVYTLDHVMDRELGPPLNTWPGGVVLLAATSLLTYAPQRLLLHLECDLACIIALQRDLAEGLSRMSEGQWRDLSSQDAELPSPDEIELAIRGKTGERRALYATMAAKLAGADTVIVDLYGEYARALGIARQMKSDLIDLLSRPISRDLASGTRTLPLALYLKQEDEKRKRVMLELLRLARDDPTKTPQVRTLLRESGIFREVIKRSEIQCQKALHALEKAKPLKPAKQHLVAAVQEVSLMHK